MPSIYSSSGDGWAQGAQESTFASGRMHSGAASDNNNVRDTYTVIVESLSGKGGGETHFTRRAFFFFNTSGISIAPSEATLKIKGYNRNNSDVIAVKSTAADPVVNGSYNDFPTDAVTALGNSDGSGAGTFAGVSGLTYSAELSTWSTSGYNDIELNSTALSDMASLDTFKVCVMDYDYDYLDIAPSIGTLVGVGNYWQNSGGTGNDPYIDYTEGVASVAHNATFFGASF